MSRYSVRSEVTRKYYERRPRKFFDFIEFEVEVEDVERRYNDFAAKGKGNMNWAITKGLLILAVENLKSRGVPLAIRTFQLIRGHSIL